MEKTKKETAPRRGGLVRAAERPASTLVRCDGTRFEEGVATFVGQGLLAVLTIGKNIEGNGLAVAEISTNARPLTGSKSISHEHCSWRGKLPPGMRKIDCDMQPNRHKIPSVDDDRRALSLVPQSKTEPPWSASSSTCRVRTNAEQRGGAWRSRSTTSSPFSTWQ